MAARRRWGLGCGRLGVAGIAVLGLLALAIAGVALVSSRGAATAPRPADRVQSAGMPSRLRSLSPQAQSQISTALGSGRSGYAAQPAGGGWRLAGGGLHARLGRTASTVGADGGSVSLSLSGLGRGTIRHSLRDGVAPIAAGNRVVYRARGLAEWFAAGPLGLEQGFTISHRPAGSRRALTVAMRVAGSLRAMATGAQVEFVTRSGAVALRYGGLAATDATGRRLPAALVLRGNSLLLRITDRGARYPVQIDPFFQQGSKLVGDGASAADFGTSLGLSANGTTAVIGAPGDNGGAGAAWLFTSSDGLWSAGKKIIGNCTSSCANQGTGETSSSGAFGESVAVSGDGSTVLVAAPFDDSGDGAAWVFTQSGGAWTQQARLVADCTSSCADRGAGETGHGNLGTSAALDTTGDVALLGADNDSSGQGAAWAYARNNGTWTQRGAQLTGTCSDTCAGFGDSVALSGTGATALVGGGADNSGAGGAWVFGVTVGQVGLNYVQDGNELTGDCAANGDLCANRGRGETGAGQFGSSVTLSTDGNTALIGGDEDDSGDGGAWVFVDSNSAWISPAPKLVANCTSSCTVGSTTEAAGESGAGQFGSSVALSSDGSTALIGGPQDAGGNGAAWLFTRSGTGWAAQGPKLVGDCAAPSNCSNQGTGENSTAGFGDSVALASDATSALVGGAGDGGNSAFGAAWAFGPAQPPPVNTPAPPVNTTAPAISGTAAAGQTVACSQGQWTNSPTGFAYEWDRAGTPIAGATGTTYQLQAADAGQSVTCTVTASNAAGPASATSAAVAIPALPRSVAFTISPDTDPLLVGETVTFAVTNPASGVTYQFNYGNGVSSSPSGPTETYTYPAAGVYQVSVTATSAGKEIAYAAHTVVVVKVQPPTAAFSILRSSQGADNPTASTDVTRSVTILPEAELPQTDSTAQDRIVREDFWLAGDGPPAAPDITCLSNGACGHYSGTALEPSASELTPVPGVQAQGTATLLSNGTPFSLNACRTSTFLTLLGKRGDCPRYQPSGGFGSFSINFWNAALAKIGSPAGGFASTPGIPPLHQEEAVDSATSSHGWAYSPLTVGYPPLGSVNLSQVDGYKGEQGIPYASCLPGYPYTPVDVTTPSPNGTSECDAIANVFQLEFEPEADFQASGFGPYDLSNYGADSTEQLEDQWNFLYNYSTVVGVDTPMDAQFGPATGATEGPGSTTVPRKITMVAYDSEGVPSKPSTQSVPLTPATNPTLSFCLEDVSPVQTPCVNTPTGGQPLPFSVTTHDTLRLKLTNDSSNGDPIRYYAIEVGQPNTANVKETVAPEKYVSDCVWPSGVGSWSFQSPNPPASYSTSASGGSAGASDGSTTGPKTLPTGPKTPQARRAASPHEAVAPGSVPVFSDLLAGGFPAHNCQSYADRTVDASAPPGKSPTSGPNVNLHAASIRSAAVPRSNAHTAPTIAEPVLITANPDKLDFTLPKQGTYSVSVAAYTAAGLGAVTRIDGLLAESGQHSGRCETVESKNIAIGSHDFAFSGNCMTVVSRGSYQHPVLYVSSTEMDISGVPLTPQPGDSIVIDPNQDKIYVARCSISDHDLDTGSIPSSCREPSHAGTLYLALGSGSGGLPGIGQQTDFTTAKAKTVFHLLTGQLDHGRTLERVGATPHQTTNPVTGCGLYPASQQWPLSHAAAYDGFSVATLPCVAFSATGQARVAFWDSLPKGFGDGASQRTPTSEVILYGSDVPAVSDLSTHPYANVALARRRPKPVIAGSFPTVRARTADLGLPGFPKIPSCPPSTSLKSGLTIPKDTDMGPISLPAGASFCYLQSTGDFIGDVNVDIPAPLPLQNVNVGFEIGHGRLIDAGGEISGDPGINLAPTPIFISDLKFDIQTDPTAVAGAITASIASILNIEGGVIVDSYDSKTTPSVNVEGEATLAGIHFGDFALDFSPQGIGMHVTISKDFGPASIDIHVSGALGFSPPAFYLEGGGDLCLFVCYEVTGLVSSEGLAACGTIHLLVVSFTGGLGILWSGPNSGVHVFTGCDLQPYIPPSLQQVAGQTRVRAGPGAQSRRARAASGLATQPPLTAGLRNPCLPVPYGTEPAGCISLHQSAMCPPTDIRPRSGCTASTVAIQVHSLANPEAPGQTPLITLTGPHGDPRTITTPATAGYYGLNASAAMSGGTENPGQTDESTALVDQNPAPVDDLVSNSSAYCRADADKNLPVSPSSCPKVTTTTVFIADPGAGEWRLNVEAGSPAVVDYAVAQQQPAVTAQQFNPVAHKVTLTGTHNGFLLHSDGHTFSSSLLHSHKLLLTPSVEISPNRSGGDTHLVTDPTVDDLDVPAIDAPRLRLLMLKAPSSFQGNVTLLDDGSNGASQVLTNPMPTSHVPSGGLPVLFQPIPDAGSHQRVVAFLSDSDGIPSKEITLSSLGTPAVIAPRPPKILKIGRGGSTVNVFFQPGDNPIANGIGLALTADNGEVIQDRFTASQLRPFGPLRGIGAARQAEEYEVSIPNVDPTVHIEIAMDGSNDGVLSRTSTFSLRPLVRSITEPRLISGLRSGRRL